MRFCLNEKESKKAWMRKWDNFWHGIVKYSFLKKKHFYFAKDCCFYYYFNRIKDFFKNSFLHTKSTLAFASLKWTLLCLSRWLSVFVLECWIQHGDELRLKVYKYATTWGDLGSWSSWFGHLGLGLGLVLLGLVLLGLVLLGLVLFGLVLLGLGLLGLGFLDSVSCKQNSWPGLF